MKKLTGLLLTITTWQIMFSQGVGIGTTTPHAPLQFESQAAERKIVLFEGANNDHEFIGFGVTGFGALKYQTANAGNDHVFQSALGPTFSQELMRIKGNGNVGINIDPYNQMDISQLGFPRTGFHGLDRPLYVTGDLYPDWGIEFRHYNGTQGIGFGYNTIYATGSNVDQSLSLASRGFAPLTFVTNAVERMHIAGNGNVGIGVTSPAHKLDIHSDVPRTGTHATGQSLYVTGDFFNGYGVQFRQTDGTEGIGFGPNIIYAAGSNASQHMMMAAKGPDGSVIFGTDYYERLRISPTGNVGINNYDPHAPLQFSNDVGNRKIVLYELANNDHQFFGLGVNGDGTFRYQTPNTINDHVFYAAPNATTSNELFRIRGTGHIGMGVSNPLNRLDINAGTARINTHPTGLAGYITGEFTASGNGVEFRNYDATQGIGFGSNTVYAAGSNTNQDLSIAAKGTTGGVALKTNAQTRLMITGNGNVGIGTSSPNGKLQFAQELLNRKIVLFETAPDEHQFAGFGTDPQANIRYQISLPTLSHVFYSGTSSTTSQELMRIMGSGNIGINLSNALNRLDINNGAATRTGTHATGLGMYVTGDFGAASNGVEYRHNDGTQGIGFGYNTIYAAGSNANQDINLTAKGATGNIALTTAGTERLKITGTGNLGLNVTTPLNKLDIHSGTARTNTHNGGQSLYVTGNSEFRSADATTGLVIASNNVTAAGSNTNIDLNLGGKGATGNIIFKTNNLERVRISGSKVGIGVTSPNAPLHLAGIPENRKIILFESTANDHQFYGFGVNGNILRYQTDHMLSDHVFYSAIDGTSSKELMRIKGDGTVGIGTNTPNAPLQFSNTSENRKMVLYDINDNDHQFIGLGHNITSLRYQVNQTGSDHIFYAGTTSTTSNELMRIEGTGDVGIGLSAPANKLDIASAARTLAHPTGRPLYVTGNISANAAGVEFRNNDGTQGLGFGSNTIYAAGSLVDHNLGLEAKGTGYVRFSAGGSERVRVTSTGKVGIGTTAPNAPLQFNSVAETRKIVLFEGGNNEHQFIGFGVNGDGALRYQTAANVNDHIFYTAASSAASTELMRIKGTGFVGIGTSSPNAWLQLSNNVTERKIVLYEFANNISQFSGFGVLGDGSMRYQVPVENAEHIFYSGAGPGSSIELMRMGNAHGIEFHTGVTVNNALTTTGNVTAGGDLAVNGSITTEAFASPALLNGFTNYGAGYASSAYYKDEMGRVHLRGLVQKATSHNGLAILTLPEGYRPATSGQLIFTSQAGSGLTRIDILTNGNVVVMGASTGWVSLDGISFRAD